MYYADIKQFDIANGPGVRTSLFVSGCTHRCKGCFNEVAWDFHYGNPFTRETEDFILDSLQPDYIAGLTLLGGEPFEHSNQKVLLPFLKRVRKYFPQKTIWAFSGYLFDQDMLLGSMKDFKETRELLGLLDVLVDGKFVEELKSPNLVFKGSSNQRTILVQESLLKNEIILWTPSD